MLVSVAIPTYRRLPFLKKAIADVFAQSWKDWELVVSDDEEGDGDTWRYLKELAASDARIRVIKNTRNGHGQVFNVNSAVLATRGEWIKPLFDDDRMLPDCLAEMAAIAAGHPECAMIGARAQKWRNGKHVGDEMDFTRGDVEIIPRRDTLKAMCLQDLWNGRTPTHVMMRGDIVRGGATMVEDGRFKHPLDVRWFARLLEHGAFAMSPKVLVCECQGEVASGTSELWKQEDFVTEELRRVYAEIWDRAEKGAGWPSRRAVDCGKCGIRGLYHLRIGQPVPALRCLCRMAASPGGIAITARWLLSQKFPGRFTATKRISSGAQRQ